MAKEHFIGTSGT